VSDYMAGEIWIGGRLSEALVPKLCEAICAEAVALDWGDGAFGPETAEELLAALQDDRGAPLLHLYDDQARYGQFKALESFLEDQKIQFTRRFDARYEFDAELVEYRPEIGLVCYPTNNCGEPFVTLSTLAAIAAAVDETLTDAQAKTAAQLFRRLKKIQRLIKRSMPIVVPPLEAFEIVATRNKKESVSGQ
jgi:hypothetical protein